MGDSGSYIHTALTGSIPRDRSYFYGYVVRLLAVWPHSFAPLLVVQALASGATAIVFALICSRFFKMSNSLSFLFGLLCTLDPCQLVWERYVMTETFSLLVYVLVLYWSLAYLRERRLWQLAVVQVLSVLLIGFRMSYLLRSGLHDSFASYCFGTLCSSGLTQPISSARTGSARSNNRVNARDRQYCDDVHNAWRLQVCERPAEQPRSGLFVRFRSSPCRRLGAGA